MTKTLGQVAYQAYCDSVNWKSVAGVDLPSWEAQTVRLQTAWNEAAVAVVRYMNGGLDDESQS